MIVSKGITLLAQNTTFNEDIWECRKQPAKLNKWAEFKVLFCHIRWEKRRAVTMIVKGRYTRAVQNMYSMPPPALPKEYNTKIKSIHAIVQDMQHQ